MQTFTEASVSQIVHFAELDNFSKAKLGAVFFGGGTASLMPERGLESILSSIIGLGSGADKLEVTLECEPGTIGRDKLRSAKAIGVNRISVCAQAFDDEELKSISRRHTHSQSLKLIDDCLAVGIENIHIDLMYGLPGQTLAHWAKTLEYLSTLPAQHVSAYKFYVFRHGIIDRRNLVRRPTAETEAETAHYQSLYELACSSFSSSGFSQYTLTEFARPGRKSRYIKSCFDGGDLLPIGPSSFGRCGREVWDNSPYVHLYGTPESRKFDRAVKLTVIEALKRDVILGLWLIRVPLGKLADRFKISLRPELIDLLGALNAEGKIEFDGDSIRLSKSQRFGAGEVMARLAALDTACWGYSDSGDSDADVRAGNDIAYSGEMATLIRMARRDPGLFEVLDRDPRSALSTLDHCLGLKEAENLVQAINGMSEDVHGTDNVEKLQEIWRLVQAEHSRSSYRSHRRFGQ